MSHMNRQTDNNTIKLTVNDLKGKQSVRATFKLTQQVIDLLRMVAGQLGIKQKSLFDQLLENVATLGILAHGKQEDMAADYDRRQKTFVISRRSLISLNNIAKKEQIPRDLLVEIAVKRLLPVIKTELERHKKRKVLLKEMRENLQQEKRILDKTANLLGKDDLVYEMIKNQISLAEKNIAAVNSTVERGMPMEDW